MPNGARHAGSAHHTLITLVKVLFLTDSRSDWLNLHRIWRKRCRFLQGRCRSAFVTSKGFRDPANADIPHLLLWKNGDRTSAGLEWFQPHQLHEETGPRTDHSAEIGCEVKEIWMRSEWYISSFTTSRGLQEFEKCSVINLINHHFITLSNYLRMEHVRMIL